MRGSFFAKPLEIIIEIEGERWKQGDSVRGRLILKNRGTVPHPTSGFDLQLCRAQFSAVKKKAEGAFKMLQEQKVAGDIPPGGELELQFEFQLTWNAPVTDSVSSAFVCCGPGALQLQVGPSDVIQELISTLQSQHHFGLKSVKQSKRGVEIKMSAPDGRSFVALDQLVLRAAFTEESGKPDLQVEYEFQLKQAGASNRSVEQQIPASDYLTASGRVNFDAIRNWVSQAVSTVESKILF